ncbi:fimbrial protein [Pluralibacter sp.]|uniref:fimbrial protein n=1 Tax=Pluralibacter sp. TaxID=1920032 RepID=UPI0025E89A92|nr:fimbrial protein [Pluralibacter sp.]MBV8044141.1 fimbrial protein [Pluralibacter sp.]
MKIALSLLFLVTCSVMAEDGSIRFVGSISDQTCSVDSSSKNQTVTLGKVAKSALNGTVGTRASAAHFSLVVKSCPDTVTGATVVFDGNGDTLYPNLLALDDESGKADGVAVQIADKTGREIPLHSSSSEFPLTTGTNTLDFTARYVSTKAVVTVGTANATTQFTIVYK